MPALLCTTGCMHILLCPALPPHPQSHAWATHRLQLSCGDWFGSTTEIAVAAHTPRHPHANSNLEIVKACPRCSRPFM